MLTSINNITYYVDASPNSILPD